MEKPLVSIVTITYNLMKAGREQHIRQCIESVHNQTYQNIEHIVIDGASDDGTVELLKEYSDKGWIKLVSEPDEGIYFAMNKGAGIAKGEYILFLNSDDFLSGEKGIEKEVRAFEKSKADYAYAKARIIDEEGKRVTSHLHNKTDITKIFLEMPFCHQTLLVKTRIFKELGMFDLSYKSAADYDFVLKLVLAKKRQMFVPYELVTYRVGGFSNADKELSLKELLETRYKNYSRFVEMSKEECDNTFYSRNIPPKLLFKLVANSNLGIKANFKLLFNNLRKKLFKVRLSLKNPALCILGFEIIKQKG